MLVIPHASICCMVFLSPCFISSMVSGGSAAIKSCTGFAPCSLRFPSGSPVSGSLWMSDGGGGSGVSLVMPASSRARLFTLMPS